VGGVIYTPRPRSHVGPFGSRMRPPPLQHAPVWACARSRTRPRPDTCPHRNGCPRIAFRPHEDIVFAPGPTRLRPLTCVCARRVCTHSRGLTKSPRPVPRVRASSPCPFPPVRAQSYPPAPNAVALLPLGIHGGPRGRPVCARSHFPLAPPAAACAPSSI
jgi:hypothetical protein